jgi:hypothetical protein
MDENAFLVPENLNSGLVAEAVATATALTKNAATRQSPMIFMNFI